jgi:hypothetical protein
MSTAKLTLSVDPHIIREAKLTAASRHTSVSTLFARLLRAVGAMPESDLGGSPITRQATGLIGLPSDKTDENLLTDALGSKYGTSK